MEEEKSKRISRDTPLAEITLRRYEKPNLRGRNLVRKLCLSIGLLQPGDSRDVIVDVLHVMLKEKKEMDSEEIREKAIQMRKEDNLPVQGVAPSNIRRQLKRLRDAFIIEKIINSYRMNENLSMTEIMEEKVEKLLMPSITERVKDYFKAVDEEFNF